MENWGKREQYISKIFLVHKLLASTVGSANEIKSHGHWSSELELSAHSRWPKVKAPYGQSVDDDDGVSVRYISFGYLLPRQMKVSLSLLSL